MDFIKHSLESIQGVSIYPIISFIIFFAVFILAVVHTFSIKKEEINEMKNIPMEDDLNHNNTN